jgi:hypothetical protein
MIGLRNSYEAFEQVWKSFCLSCIIRGGFLVSMLLAESLT